MSKPYDGQDKAMEDLRTHCETLRGGCLENDNIYLSGLTANVVDAIKQLLGYLEGCCPAIKQRQNKENKMTEQEELDKQLDEQLAETIALARKLREVTDV